MKENNEKSKLDAKPVDPDASSEFIVIYIGGLGRSGSTLLADLLATLPGFVSVGELPTLWRHGWRDDWRSSDGYKFSTSPVWQEVVTSLAKLDEGFSPERSLELTESIFQNRHRISIGLKSWSPGRAEQEREYVSHFCNVYRILAQTTGAKVIVDSGKVPYHAALMAKAKSLDFRIIHLIRDPRAISYSRLRNKKNMNVSENEPYFMMKQRALKVGMRWNWCNFLFILLLYRTQANFQVGYKQLVQAPDTTVRSLLRKLGVAFDEASVESLAKRSFQNLPGIAFSGNSSRFTLQEKEITLDDSWRFKLSPSKKIAVYIITLPIIAWLRLHKFNLQRP